MLTEAVMVTQKIKRLSNFAIFIINNKKGRKVLDMTLTEWLQKELNCYPLYVIDHKEGEDIKEKIGLYCNNYEYIFVLYDKTPFVNKNLIETLIEYVSTKGSKACKLPCGAIYMTSYYLGSGNINYDSIYMNNQELFTIIETEEQVAMAEKYFSKKIIIDLQKQGVAFENPNSVIISAKSTIGRNCTIFSNCVFRGKCTIGDNTIINNNSTIIDSKIGNNSSVSNSIITKSNIGNNVIISPYCDIKKSKISDNAVIGYYVVLDNYTIKKNEIIKDRTTLAKEKQ